MFISYAESKYRSTERRALKIHLIVWLSVSFFPVRVFHSYIESPFRKRVGLKSISIIYSLYGHMHCSNLFNYRAKGILRYQASAIHRLSRYYYMILSSLKVSRNVFPAERLHFVCGQSRVRVRIHPGFCSAYGSKRFHVVYMQNYTYDNHFNKLK